MRQRKTSYDITKQKEEEEEKKEHQRVMNKMNIKVDQTKRVKEPKVMMMMMTR